jgi:hypothetical protein
MGVVLYMRRRRPSKPSVGIAALGCVRVQAPAHPLAFSCITTEEPLSMFAPAPAASPLALGSRHALASVGQVPAAKHLHATDVHVARRLRRAILALLHAIDDADAHVAIARKLVV